MLFAGLHSWWRDPAADGDAGWHLTTTMLTMESYGPMRHIHHRMPVLISGEMLHDWLDPSLLGIPELYAAVEATSKEVGTCLTEHRVAPLTGDGPALTLAVNSPEC